MYGPNFYNVAGFIMLLFCFVAVNVYVRATQRGDALDRQLREMERRKRLNY